MATPPGGEFTERTPRVVAAVKLHRPAARRAVGRFLVEGVQAVTEALAHGVVHELFVTAEASARHPGLVAGAQRQGVGLSPVTAKAAAALSETVTPQGIVAVCALVEVDVPSALARDPRLVAVLVDAGEPGNAGTVVRVADAAGADAVLFAGDSVDVHNGKCVRASTGSVFHLPVARHRDTTALMDRLHEAGLQVLATTVDGEIDLDDADELLAVPTAWLFGNEAHGIDPALAATADHRVRVPIHGRAESLNVAAAAAVCLYASARVQRRAAADRPLS